MRRGNEGNNVPPQDGDRLPIGAGEHIAAHDGEIDLVGRECLHIRFEIRHRHDFQVHAGIGVCHGAYKGGEAFLAGAAPWASGHTQGPISKENPCDNGPKPDKNQ
jgi:hypothetical protein